MRKKIVAGNWKMNTDPKTAVELAKGVAQGVGADDSVTVIVCPPFPCLPAVAEALQGSRVKLGAQNCYHEAKGAFTGEVSPPMLTTLGCEYVILGHSERRQVLDETDGFINLKVLCALEHGLKVICCFGETLEQGKASQTHDVLRSQFNGSLAHLPQDKTGDLIIAYEPVWAIGTNHNASPEQAQEAHTFIRGLLAERFNQQIADNMVIQYGGSMKPKNAAELLAQPDVDGGLIGGAALIVDDFLAIVKAARS